MEIATGRFPYPRWNSVFEQLVLVVMGDPPKLTTNDNGNVFSERIYYGYFIYCCMTHITFVYKIA